MANLLRRLTGRDEQRYSLDQWLTEYYLPSLNQFSFQGATYPFSGVSSQASKVREVAQSLPAFASALRACPPAFAAEMVRVLVLSQTRFTWRNRPSSSRTPRRVWGNTDLEPLERPWTNATTGELISRVEWHAGLAGNAYVTNRMPGRLRILRPDWVAIVYGSQLEPDDPSHALDGEIVGYLYQSGGLNAGNKNRVDTLLPAEVAHWSPIPDPEQEGIGMSWLTPALREVQVDRSVTDHKLAFFSNGASPSLVIKGLPGTTRDKFNEAVDMMEARHSGVRNAYRTWYLTAGADATVVTATPTDFKAIQGIGETRIATLSRVPATVLGISEGLQGSTLNAGNFGQSRRLLSDTWVLPTLQDLAAALSPLVQVPADSELWFDTVDMPLLREDAKDAAEIEMTKQQTITAYVKEGFTPESAVAAVNGQDITLLKHTGLVSVQLQPPGATPALPAANGNGTPKPMPAVPAAK